MNCLRWKLCSCRCVSVPDLADTSPTDGHGAEEDDDLYYDEPMDTCSEKKVRLPELWWCEAQG